MTLVTDGQASSTFSVELPVESFISRQTQNECKVVCVLDIEELPASALRAITPRGKIVTGTIQADVLIDGLSTGISLQTEIAVKVFKETETFYIAAAAQSLKQQWEDLPEWAKKALVSSAKFVIKAALL
eukprot:TRINITY_DN2392_c0_g1_i3.p1 TRINITY_DN2392_c0_g1~~TRINITY_DN2392_c0_g1_i3.p1  ORF type:complete len:129 (-),score=30.09 TRINITY_DN2392_c0_g1_i3:97-483(-)